MKKYGFKCLFALLTIGVTSCSLWDPSFYIGDDPDIPSSDMIVFNITEDDFKEGKGSKTTLSFYDPISGNDSGYLQALVHKWNRAFGKSYFIQQNSNTESIHYQKIDTNLNNNTAPDIAIIHNTRVPYYQGRGKLRDMTSWAEDTGIKEEDYIEGSYSSGIFEGKLYSLIYDMIPTFLFYNKKLIPEGYTEEDIQAEEFTVETMLEMAKASYEYNHENVNKTKYGVAFNYAFTEQPFLNFLYQQEGRVVSPSNYKKAAYNSTKGYNAAEALKNIANTYVDGHHISQLSGDDHITIFANGRALFTIDGIWQEENLLLHNDVVDTGMTLLPRINIVSGERNTYADGHCLVSYVNKKQSGIRDIGIKLFIKYLVDNSAFWCQGGKMAVRKDTLESELYQNLEWYFVSKEEVKVSTPEKKRTFSYLIKTMPNYVSKLCEGTLTNVQDAINSAASEGEELVKDW